MSQQSSNVHIFNPEGHASLVPSYSHISVVPISSTTKLVSFAGQVGILAGDYSRPSFPDQVRNALAKTHTCLAATGVSRSHIVSIRQYVVKLLDMSAEDRKARVDIFLEWWKRDGNEKMPPPSTLIGVDSLASEGVLFEIEITCVASL